MKYLIFFISWIAVFASMDMYFHIENNLIYAVVGYCFSIYQLFLDYFFDKPY